MAGVCLLVGRLVSIGLCVEYWPIFWRVAVSIGLFILLLRNGCKLGWVLQPEVLGCVSLGEARSGLN